MIIFGSLKTILEKGVIQIILGREGHGQQNVTRTFFAFRKTVLMLLERKLFDTKQDNASKGTF
jgi:hypothetical protein